jgi:uncharacterized protein YjbI with pentapeptide repeats
MSFGLATRAAVGLAGRETRTVDAAGLGFVLTLHAAFLARAPGGRRASLKFTNLSGIDLSGRCLAEADLSGALLQGANLVHADLREANLFGADPIRADLQGADLTGASLCEAVLLDADLRRARLQGTDLTDCIGMAAGPGSAAA